MDQRISNRAILRYTILLVASLFVINPILVNYLSVQKELSYFSILIFFLTISMINKYSYEALLSIVYILSIFAVDLSIPTEIYSDAIGRSPELEVYLAAPFAVILVISTLYRIYSDSREIQLATAQLLATICATLFTLTLAIPIFADIPSKSAASIYFFEHLYYLLLFFTSLLIVNQSSPWTVLIPVFSSITGNLVFAALSAVSASFGLYSVPATAELGVISIGSLQLLKGWYASGFVGHSRELVLILMIILPFYFVRLFESVRNRTSYLILVLSSILILIVSDTLSGIGAFFLVSTLSLSYLLYRKISVSYIKGWPILIFTFASLFIIYMGGGWIAEFLHGTFLSVDNLSVRVEQYSLSLEILTDHPLFGIGGYNSPVFLHPHMEESVAGVHNIFLAQFVASGLVGGTFYISFMFLVLLWAFRKSLIATADDQYYWFATITGIVGFLSFSSLVMAQDWQQAQSCFWIFSGVVLSTNTWYIGSVQIR
ncbi:O-antigen ligase family protein [Halobacterium salinarum]|uniref:O-antigen ligase family protein n=1 Tax=Halobacterium salinarum TaxID=2242 RepID=UPI0025561EDB|nr:O-antigen ligase family protein [Halobacterium salinarum]MDL0145389.1 O-antigen ligase family protein [Halobacterium salinarum]